MPHEATNFLLEPGEWAIAKPAIARVFRVLFYTVLSYALITQNTYGVYDALWLPVAIGALGLGSTSARLGLYAIGALLLMAIFPISVVQTLWNIFA